MINVIYVYCLFFSSNSFRRGDLLDYGMCEKKNVKRRFWCSNATLLHLPVYATDTDDARDSLPFFRLENASAI